MINHFTDTKDLGHGWRHVDLTFFFSILSLILSLFDEFNDQTLMIILQYDIPFCKMHLKNISAATARFNGSILIDLSFNHYEKYPSLLFNGEHMKTIHMLGADLSIDPY